MAVYQAYLFKDKDPAIDEFRTVVEDELGVPLNSRKQLRVIEANGGPTLGTLANWFFGDVKRPQNPTLEAAGRALGYKRAWTKMSKNEFSEVLRRKPKPKKKRNGK